MVVIQVAIIYFCVPFFIIEAFIEVLKSHPCLKIILLIPYSLEITFFYGFDLIPWLLKLIFDKDSMTVRFSVKLYY